ncbi:MAG: DUF4352 domain-containing protein [Chloroflexi bacterium]|nr:DUF4352 domain-containing protein [Chloroflexota bacterium]
MPVALRRARRALVTLGVALLFSACGGQPGANLPASTPSPAPATRPPPSPPPATSEPPTATVARPMPIQLVQFSALAPYRHSSGVFTIAVPANWSLQVNDRPDELIHIWTDPSRNGGVIVDVFEDDLVYNDGQLRDILRSFLVNSFGAEPGFSLDEPVTRDDGRVLISWAYTARADNGVEVPLQGRSFIEQRGDKVALLTFLFPREQNDAGLAFSAAVLTTYRIEPAARLAPAVAATSTPTASAAAPRPTRLVAIGEPISTGSLTLTVTAIEQPAGDSVFAPDSGNRFLVVRVVFTNAGSAPEAVSTLQQMEVIDAAGRSYPIDLYATILAEKSPDGEVPAGGSLAGGVGFQVPIDASGLVFVFQPARDGEPVGVTLE